MQEYYYELKITPDSLYEQFLDLLMALTGEAIEELDGSIIARSQEDLSTVEFGIKQFADALNIQCLTSLEKNKNEDWVNKYKNAIQPIVVGKFYVRPSWVDTKDNLLNIIIDPALAFGSGHHETTSSCLEAISKVVEPKTTLLDVGCGSGILGIAAAKLGAVCDACDTDELAVQNARKNFELNSCSINKTWIGSVTQATEQYDVVMANIVADVLIMIANDLKKSLKKDGILILSGILDKHHDKVLKKFNNLVIMDTIYKNEWVTIILKNNTEDINE
ncbi:MAG: 50S ribosomal protein L11 methyltransferase [Campylobacterota bacterium]|nr:50S ribosomal protein L11 methyltransferase [Campylobacterota bacterium]